MSGMPSGAAMATQEATYDTVYTCGVPFLYLCVYLEWTTVGNTAMRYVC